MKRISVLVAVTVLLTNAIPAFAQSSGEKENNLFAIIAGTLKPGEGKEKNKVKKIEKISVFQSLADGINKGSEEAKGKTLRTQK